MEDAEPRGKFSVWLLGLLLGPVVLMLWLGRGRLALIYLVIQLLLGAATLVAIGSGLVAPPALRDFGLAAFVFYLPFKIVGLVHGLKIRATELKRPWFSRWYAIILPLAASWLIPFVIREYFHQPFTAPSASMIPGLMVGDYFFVSKIAYGEPERGDIVVFKLPRDNQTDYVQRLIGLPGDRVQMKDGMVHLNGEALPLARAEGIPCIIEQEGCKFFRETLPDGRSYVINDSVPNGSSDNTDEYVVPDGHYFMMGDNRDNSLDSRYLDMVGYIPRANLTGPAVLIFWNSMGTRIDDRLQGYPGR